MNFELELKPYRNWIANFGLDTNTLTNELQGYSELQVRDDALKINIESKSSSNL